VINYKTIKTPEQVLKCFEQVKGTRLNWESLWDDLAYYTAPLKEYYQSASGERKYTHLLDTTAMTSAELLAGALHSMLTNPAGYFFTLTTGNYDMDQKDSVRRYIQQTVRILHDIINNSNFQTEVHEMYLSLVSLGNSCMLTEEDEDTDVRFSTRPLNEFYFTENSKGMVDTLYRCFSLDCAGLVDEFGLDNLPKRVQKQYRENSTEKHEVVHIIYPRKKTKEAKKEFRFDFVSQYILKKDKVNLDVKGFNEFPYVTPRWSKMPGEVYGRGPGEKALGPAMALNVMRETVIIGAQKVVDPPLQAPDDGFMVQLNTTPGGISYYRAGSQDRIQPVFNDSRIDFGYQAIEQERLQVREAFYTDQLKLREGPQMTATEVSERVEQALRFMGPMLGRLETEFLGPLVARVFNIADKRDKLPPVPEELNGIPLRVRYSSVMAMQQRMSEINNIRRTMQEAAPFISLDQSLGGLFSGSDAIRYIAKLTNFPQELIKDKEVFEQEVRAQQEQQQAMMQAEMQSKQVNDSSKMIGAAAKMQAQ
jgi:hypothetical protein